MEASTNLSGTVNPSATPRNPGSSNEQDLPTRIGTLETKFANLENSFGELASAVNNVAPGPSAEFQNFVDGLFSKYFRGEWEAFKAKIAAMEKPTD